ncbi:MAG: hypothetical protein COA96_06020 [SAR86 cluster bacterium]|uniref:Endolytic murein transglycosylase n=1 Tax=SAR86 cluster bacterium TaxID=2030880 RepID=A0A2A5B3A5_9GAMM|nr:MAG: hypothetical protein COA96_06020 [SAR86 cluster bacterium]
MKPLALPAKPFLRQLVIATSVLSAFTIVFIIFAVSFLYSPISALDKPSDLTAASNQPLLIEVLPGSSFSRIATELNSAGVIQYPLLFKLLAKWQGVENLIKTGEYELQAGLSPAQLLDEMVQGKTVQYRVTLVEGWTFKQALDAIWASENIESSLIELDLQDIAARMELDADHPEGMLFPDTYFYTKGTTDLELIKRANRKLDAVLAEAWDSRVGALPYENKYEALIMASVIEKESANNSERGHIAGVFVQRLDLGMRLQSDPTIIYGMGDAYDGDIRRQDIDTATAYNTYRIDGLPPTPIALAGLESIEAALNPLPSGYLYFVSKGDGSHYFSATLEEHNAAVREYQK